MADYRQTIAPQWPSAKRETSPFDPSTVDPTDADPKKRAHNTTDWPHCIALQSSSLRAIEVLFCLTLALALGRQVAVAQDGNCSGDEISRAAEQVVTARKALLDLPIAHELDVSVSSDAQQAIAAMKQRLGDLVVAYMRCAGSNPDLRKIEQDLSALARSSDAESRKL